MKGLATPRSAPPAPQAAADEDGPSLPFALGVWSFAIAAAVAACFTIAQHGHGAAACAVQQKDSAVAQARPQPLLEAAPCSRTLRPAAAA